MARHRISTGARAERGDGWVEEDRRQARRDALSIVAFAGWCLFYGVCGMILLGWVLVRLSS